MELIYENAALYQLTMRLLYGRHYAARFRAIADIIPPRSSVVDLCCGPALLYRYLQPKGVDYTGIDASANFIASLKNRGGRGMVRDLRDGAPLPAADYLVIQGALYFFLPDPSPLIERMLRSAKKAVIVAESVRNISSSSVPFVSSIAKRLAGAVSGNHPARFTESTLDALFARYGSRMQRSFKVPGQRDKVYVLEGANAGAAVH